MTLPRVTATVLAEAVDALPARLRKKLDDAVARFATLAVAEAGGQYTVVVDDATTVTLRTSGGVLRAADAATCTCLLSPNCLHRVGILARCPVDDGTDEPEQALPPAGAPDVGGPSGAESGLAEPGRAVPDGAQPATSGGPAGEDQAARLPDDTGAVVLGPAQAVAVENLWSAATAILSAGVTGAGVVARTALLRAAHDAQAAKVYRPAAAARAVATLVQAARANEPQYRLADLADALRDLLGVLHQLRRAPDGGLLGVGRRPYEVQGSLRLYGLCTTAVLTDSGYAGVVTYVADRDGRLWTIADLMPGDARRAAAAGNATVALGETALSHRALTRAGLVVSGATASATRQLGAGRSVRAVTAAGAGWLEGPFEALWLQPLAAQVHRAFAASALPVNERPAGDDLLFLRVRLKVNGWAVTPDGTMLTFGVASDDPALAYRENLRLLGGAPGLEVLVIARPDPARQGTVLPLAVAPPPGAAWTLEKGHADLAFDRLHRSDLPYQQAYQDPGEAARTTGDPALQLLRAQVERTVSGGRTVSALADRYPSDAVALRRARLDNGAALLDRLTLAAATRPRDAFGRLTGDDGSAFARAWLATAVYTDVATRAFAEASWLRDSPAGPLLGVSE